MKKHIFLLCCGLLLTSLWGVAQSFEGTVRFKMTDKDNVVGHICTLKGNQSVVITMLEDVYLGIFYNTEQGERFKLKADNETKIAYKIPVKANTGIKYEKTQETKTILGKTCTKILAKDAKNTTVLWATPELKIDVLRLIDGKSSPDFVKMYGTVLAFEGKDAFGKSVVMEVVEITPKNLSEEGYSFPNMKEYRLE